jgi:hypothetical protein
MNKTIEYAVNEALNMGYQAGRIGNSFEAMALREQLAQLIEDYEIKNENAQGMKMIALAIVRGNSD